MASLSIHFQPRAIVPAYMQWSNRGMPKVYNPPPRGFCQKLSLDSTDNIAMVIGKNGAVFNAITHQTPDLTYIWFDKRTKQIEVWGDTPMSVHAGYHKILNRIEFVKRTSNE